jgi:hypothetical protein
MATPALRRGVSYAGPACPHCRRGLDLARLVAGMQHCPACGGAFEAVRFDPPEPGAAVRPMAEAGPEGATPCGNHPGNAAEGNCQRCGVFICGLCRIDTDGISLCPACFERLSDEGALASSRVAYRDYARLASSLAALGVFLWFIAPVAGIGVAYYGLKGLKQKREAGESQVGTWAALVLGAAEIVGGLWLLSLLVRTGGS